MAYNSTNCPRCGSYSMTPISERTGGFSGKKAALGGVLLGPIGIAAGAFGKKKTLYRCSNCGYTVER